MKGSKVILAAALALIALTGLGLSRLQSLQRLGTPGVKLVPHTIVQEDGTVLGTNTIALPERVLDFDSKEQPIARIVADWLPKDTTFAQRIYQRPDGFWIQANVVLMGTDRTSIHKPEYCLAGQGFRTEKVETDLVRVATDPPYDIPVQKWTVSREGRAEDGTKVAQKAIYVFWFIADGQLTASHNERMWWMSRDLITRGVLQRWAYASCFAPCRPGGEEESYRQVSAWIAHAAPSFQFSQAGRGTAATPPPQPAPNQSSHSPGLRL